MAAVGIIGALFAGFIGLIVVAAILRGWALSILWGWFAVPFGLPPLSVAQAIGIALLIAMLTHQTNASSKSKDKDAAWEALAMIFLMPLFSLLIGWIVRAFW